MAQALDLIGLDSAFGWVQVRLRGGWLNLFVTSAVYGVALGATMYFPSRLLGPNAPTASYYGGWVYGLLGIQAALLLLFAGSRVTAAVRLDFSTRMIESHRLMPAGCRRSSSARSSSKRPGGSTGGTTPSAWARCSG